MNDDNNCVIVFLSMLMVGLVCVCACVAGLGNYKSSGVCRARVSPDERVGGDLGECRLPRVQLLPQVSALSLPHRVH